MSVIYIKCSVVFSIRCVINVLLCFTVIHWYRNISLFYIKKIVWFSVALSLSRKRYTRTKHAQTRKQNIQGNWNKNNDKFASFTLAFDNQLYTKHLKDTDLFLTALGAIKLILVPNSV